MPHAAIPGTLERPTTGVAELAKQIAPHGEQLHTGNGPPGSVSLQVV
jgi:hypothetical protein